MEKSLLPVMQIKPMLAVAGELFDSDEYLYEIKWDGYRSIVYLDEKTWVQSRNLNDMAGRFPELLSLHLNIKHKPAVIDGEIITLVDGKPAFQPLLARDRLRSEAAVKKAANTLPAILVAFDVIYMNGKDVTREPLLKRREMLENMITESDNLNVSRFIIGRGKDLFAAAKQNKLEGIVAKQLQSPYLPGKRSPLWVKIKRLETKEFVILGYLPSVEGVGTLGSLLLGAYEDGILNYMGSVGTGFCEKEKKHLLQLLEILKRADAPVRGIIMRGARWVEPKLVCTVDYLERTTDGKLRHPSYKGLRTDKLPEECVVE